jgi:hypothetical protein
MIDARGLAVLHVIMWASASSLSTIASLDHASFLSPTPSRAERPNAGSRHDHVSD